jgi:hypothetical protein
MGFEVEVTAHATGSLLHLLADSVGESSIRATDDTLVLSVVDQAALVAVVARLNDLGITIDNVRRG